MPSTSPGSHAPTTSTPFEQILPGKPVAGVQSLTTFAYRHKRYVAYISGRQLSILSSSTVLAQAITFSEPLVSVTAEAESGKIAVATKEAAWVLEPVTEGWTKIWWERALSLKRGDPGDEPRWLSWGGDGELLVGGSRHLCLYSTVPSSRSSSPAVAPSDGGEAVEERRSLWSKATSSPIRWAAFSPSANLIATCGERDRLVKIWRRLSFEEGLFDHTYLPHPVAVTHLQWRPLEEGFEERRGSGKSGRHDDEPEVLHTIANDGVLRVWRTGGTHDLDILVLHTTVDLVAAIPQSPSLSTKATTVPTAKSTRYAFTIPAFHFTAAVKAAIGLQLPETKLSHSLEHLKEVSSKEPDIIITLDGHGRMSAWGLQSIGHKRRPETPSGLSKQAFHIAHCEDLPVKFHAGEAAAFEIWFEDSALNVLTHGFHGEVTWWKSETEAFFSPASSGSERLQKLVSWSGLDDAVSGLHALPGAGGLPQIVSYSSNGTVSQWATDNSSPLKQSFSCIASSAIMDAVSTHQSGHLVALEGTGPLTIHHIDNGQQLAQKPLTDGTEGARNSRMFSVAPRAENGSSPQRFVVLWLTSDRHAGRGCTFTIKADDNEFKGVANFSVATQNTSQDLVQLAAIMEPSQPDRFGLIGLTGSGQLLLYHVALGQQGKLDGPTLVTSFESGVKHAATLTASNDFAALTSGDGQELAIIDLRDGYVEHRQKPKSPVKHLCASSKANALAVGYETYVDILAQGHYGQHNAHPTWHHIRQISIAGAGLTIAGLAWLGNGALAVAAGNGLFVSGDDMLVQELQLELREALDLDSKDIKEMQVPELTGLLKTPHAIWHPRLLAHLVHCGRWSLAASLIVRLLEKLKFWSEGDHLDPHLHVPSEQLYGEHGLQHHRVLDEELVGELHQQLEEKDLPQLSNSEQAHLRRVLDAMLFCAEHVRGLDDCALRFLFAWRLGLLDMEAEPPKTNGSMTNGVSKETAAPEMHWREIAFAHQSTTQQPLLDVLTLAYDNKISWRTARNLGLFAWLSDPEALTQIFEALAQTAYRATSPPDPINASLYFLALHKKSTLLGLWRIATWHKEQRATMNFLRRDFTVEANRTAARKNAYALMGKRRFDYAAAFFLLAEDAASATSLLAGQCGDVMLAIAVARLYAGDGSVVLRRLVEDRLLPDALKDGNRWQASWCHSILFEREKAAEALVRPLEGVRSWETDDPHTLTLYRQLRKQESEWEWEAVLRAARLLRKMGLWFAALELVRNWEFKDPREAAVELRKATQVNGVAESNGLATPPSMLDDFATRDGNEQTPSLPDGFASPAPSEQAQPASMLDGFTSPPAQPQQDEKPSREAKAAELLKQLKAKKEGKLDRGGEQGQEKRKPTQFQEPSADSLLNSFGF